ncbi:vitamin D3 hydroxylase-associated protein [Folsomia candida]|uniref:vitamin D3 hydroxylase-associated protein n=1 Tax=Folsomia candida TaxID=158441 RepID=UPI0016055BB5|nr:vitamin D3 hydroxylase-associated protein [Folsomia candida]
MWGTFTWEILGGCIGLGVAFLSIYILHEFYKNEQEKNKFTELRKRKQTERKIQFHDFRNQYSGKEDDKILQLSFSELRHKLETRQVTSEYVLKSFIAKSLQVQDELNCITEFVPAAMEKAKELDKLENIKGPLHGIPFCVKDDTAVIGMDSSCGLSRLLFKPAKESAVLVQIIENLGAIAFCRTNLPQSCLSIGSDNPIFGQTLNPLNKRLGPGGSSSGTAALVGAGGCHFGIGTDSGGSLRIPAHCCGLSTMRATFNRISDSGCLHCSPNLTTVPGILTKRSEDLGYIYQLVFNYHNEFPLDPRVPKIPWDLEKFSTRKPLRIGYFTQFTKLSPVGDIPLVIMEAKSHLEKLGHTLTPFEMPDHSRLWFSMMTDDTMAKSFLKNTKNDAISECVSELRKTLLFLPLYRRVFRTIVYVCRKLDIKSEFGQEIAEFPELEKEAFTKELLEKMENLDLLLCPVFPFCAISAHAMAPVSMKLQYAMLYSYIWNLVNFCAGVTKFGKESGQHWPTTDSILTQYKQESIGCNIGVQIVGKPYDEERVLRVLKELDQTTRME